MTLFKGFITKYKIYLYLILFAVIVSGIGYIQYLRYDNLSLTTKTQELTASLESSKQKIQNLQSSIVEINKINKDYTDTIYQLSESQRKLDEKLSKLQHTASAKPKLVKGLVNKAATERNRCFALATGAIKEKSEKNSVCPEWVK